MAGQTRKWADVYIEDIDDRARLERSALFFVPKAFEVCRHHGLSLSALNSRGTVERRANRDAQLAGRLVIDKVLHCKQPVTYDSAVSFIRLANIALPPSAKMRRSDIVACAFRLKDPEIVGMLELTEGALAKLCDLRLEVIEGATKRLRLTLRDAYKIWSALTEFVDNKSDFPEAVYRVLTGKPEDFIRTETGGNYPVAIHRIGDVVTKHSKKVSATDVDTAEYVYNRSNLQAAPDQGHPWSIDSSDDEI